MPPTRCWRANRQRLGRCWLGAARLPRRRRLGRGPRVAGVTPPVLADRGLAEAVRALALDLPLRVHFASELPGRPPAPIESAAYFAISELLANVSKHAQTRQ